MRARGDERWRGSGSRGLKWVAAGLLGLALMARPGTATAQEELAVVDTSNNSVTVYARTASGDVAPLRTLAGAGTGLSGPLGVALDLVHDELLVANEGSNSVTIYTRTASGNTAPLRTLAGAATGLNFPRGIALDLVHDEMVVVNAFNNSVTVYARTASGDTAPLRTLAGAATGLSSSRGVALDLVHDEMVVANAFNNSVTVYARTASGDTAPLRTLAGAATGLSNAFGVALDLVHDELLVANNFPSHSLTVYARTASGNTAPLRTLSGSATGLNFPAGVALDLVHDELLVANGSPSVTVHARTASGNTAPLRTLVGASTGLSGPTFLTLSTSPPLAAAVLPLSRSHQVGTLLTAFATIINAGTGPVQQCRVGPPASPPAGLGPFIFQTTDPATNQPTGDPNRPANITAGGHQTFVFGVTPSGVIAETSLAMEFGCENTVGAPRIIGVNNLILVTDANAVPDTIALISTISGDGVVRIAGSTGTQLFAIGTSNVGATGTITVSGDTGGNPLPLTLLVCETNPGTGACLPTSPPAASVTVTYAANTSKSFAFFAQASGSIAFDPGVNRVFARLKQSGVTRGATSAAVCTTPNSGC